MSAGDGNKYMQGGSVTLNVESDSLSLMGETAFSGTINFIGKSKTSVTLGPDASLGTVVINSSGGGITLNSDVRHDGDLVLERGIIESNGYTWLLEDADIDVILVRI